MKDTSDAQKGSGFVVAMLFLFMVVNFADKAILGLTAVPIMKELGLTPKQFGFIGSSFFFLYAASAVVVGFVVNRVKTKWALFWMSLVWALAQIPVLGPGAGLATLVVSRVVLGAGEGPAYPVSMHAVYKWFPNERRAFPSSVVAQGAAIGVLVAMPALGWIITHYSWRAAYAVLGLLGLIWCVVWAIHGREGTQAVSGHGATSGVRLERVPYRRLLLNPTSVGVALTEFGVYWGLALVIAWFPSYLQVGLGLPAHEVHLIAALPWILNAAAVVGLSWVSQRLMARGASSRMARGVLGPLAVLVGGAALVAMPYAEALWLKVLIVAIGVSLPEVLLVLGPAVVSEISPVRQRGATLSINTAIVTSAGLFAPYLTGSVIQSAATQREGYVHGFVICGVITLVAGVLGLLLIKPEAQIRRFEAAARRDAERTPVGELVAE